MKVDLLIFQLAIVFLPGIVWAGLDAMYVAKTKPSEAQFLLRTFLFGIVTYGVEFLGFEATGQPFKLADFATAETKEIVSQDILFEVLWGLLIGTVLAILWLYASRYKVLTRFLQFIRATKKYGDEDVWDYTFNSSDVAVEYVHFRDFTSQCVYAGWVNTFSETDKLRELILLDVIVFNFDGEELYKTPRLYLARPLDAIHIEFPYQPTNQPRTSTNDEPPGNSNGRL